MSKIDRQIATLRKQKKLHENSQAILARDLESYEKQLEEIEEAIEEAHDSIDFHESEIFEIEEKIFELELSQDKYYKEFGLFAD